jgi:hypothetical protein
MKHKKHDKLVKDYQKQKSKELDRLASKLLKNDEKNQKLKTYNINNPLDLFDDEGTEK